MQVATTPKAAGILKEPTMFGESVDYANANLNVQDLGLSEDSDEAAIRRRK